MLKYDDVGQGVPIVLIHGFPLSRKMWFPQVAALVDAGYRVICPDLPGFGESPSAPDASMNLYADSIVKLLDHLAIEKSVIGGMSMGGYVLLDLADRYPERLLTAMFLMTRAAADDEAGKEKRTLLAKEVKAGNRIVVPDAFAQVLFAPQTLIERPELVSEVRGWMETTSQEGIIGGLLAMRDRTDYLEKLPGFDLPSLVVGAEQDLAVPVEHARRLAEGLHSAELIIVPGAGHMANLEQPDLFNRTLIQFLSSVI